MKAKLLKKLRRRYVNRHTITRRGCFWYVDYGAGVLSSACTSLEHAQKVIIKMVYCDMEKYINKRKYSGFKYYPW